MEMENENEEDRVDQLSNLLNGQLRGTINASARAENLALIQMTMSRLRDDAFAAGVKYGIQETLKDQVKEDLKKTYRDIIKEESQ